MQVVVKSVFPSTLGATWTLSDTLYDRCMVKGLWRGVDADELFGLRKSRNCFACPVCLWSVWGGWNSDSLTRSMSVILSRYSTAKVLPACVRAIEALPNLHTLQFIRTHPKMSTILKGAFEDHIFPQVQTITLPSHTHNILRCWPEVRKVICINQRDSGSLVDAIAQVCNKVEEVEGFFGPEWVMKSAVFPLSWEACTY